MDNVILKKCQKNNTANMIAYFNQVEKNVWCCNVDWYNTKTVKKLKILIYIEQFLVIQIWYINFVIILKVSIIRKHAHSIQILFQNCFCSNTVFHLFFKQNFQPKSNDTWTLFLSHLGTFLCNNEAERHQCKLEHRTVSLW